MKNSEPEAQTSDERWFDDARIIDADWMEVNVNAGGERVSFRIPRRTHFDSVDKVAEEASA